MELLAITFILVVCTTLFFLFYPSLYESIRWYAGIKHARITQSKKVQYLYNAEKMVAKNTLIILPSLLLFIVLYIHLFFSPAWNQLLQLLLK
jgi:hypothetical protein